MKKCICTLIGLLLCMLAVTGCSQWFNRYSSREQEESAVQDRSQATVDFSWWGNDVRHQYTLDGLDIFEQKHPEIKVNAMYGVWDGYEKRYQIYMKSQTNADVMQINYAWLDTYSPDGNGYYDLRELDDIIDLSNFSAQDLAVGTQGGKLNALPIAYNCTTFYYNQDLYDQYGLEIPKSWDDLFAAAKVMQKDGVYPLGMVTKHAFMCMLAWYEQTSGEAMFTKEGKLHIQESGAEQMLDFLAKLIDEKVIPPIDQFSADDFFTERVAGTACWASDEQRYCAPLVESGKHVVLGDFLMTDTPKRFGWYIKPATMYAIGANTDHPQAAAELINYLLNASDMALLQGTEKGTPVSQVAREALVESGALDDLAVATNDRMRENEENMEIMLPVMENTEVLNVFKNQLDRYIYAVNDLQQCAKTFVREINRELR